MLVPAFIPVLQLRELIDSGAEALLKPWQEGSGVLLGSGINLVR